MLKIIDDLEPFFENCYNEIGVREYSRMKKITPPTASKLLKKFSSQGLLKEREDKRYLLFRANRESFVLRDLSRVYWRGQLSKLIDAINEKIPGSLIVLFGSLSKLESKNDSDIDIAVLSPVSKKIVIENFEKIYKRKIEIFKFESLNKIPEDLKKNILNGIVLSGRIE